MGTDTPFSRIRALPPNANLVWRSGALDVEGGYWIPPFRESTHAAAVDDYIDVFRQSIRRRLPEGAFTMPLSGGRDSRHIFFALLEAGRRPDYVLTGRRFPPEQPADESIARELAAAAGVPHVAVGPPDFEIPSYLVANVMTNMTAPRRGWKLSVVRKVWETCATTYDGIGGDMLSGGSALNRKRLELLERNRLSELCHSCFTNRALNRMVPGPQFARMSDDIAVERMVREMERHLGAANPVTSFFFWNRTRRFDATNPYGMYQQVPNVHSPFLDLDLFELLASLPPKFNLDGWLHDEVIARAYPEYAHIPFESDEPVLGRDPRRMARTTVDLVRYLTRQRPRHLLRPGFYEPRLALRSLSLGQWDAGLPIPFVVYLTQLETILERG